MNDSNDITNAAHPGQSEQDDIELTWQAHEEANANRPFAPSDDLLKWLRSWGTASELHATRATIQF